MGLFSFIADVGKGLGIGDDKKEAAQADAKIQELRTQKMENALKKEVEELGVAAEGVEVHYKNGKATVKGTATSQADREKIILALGNVKGVGEVEETLTVTNPEPEATFYTVQKGDTLWKVAQEHYGNGNKYTAIFEANRPMLQDPDKIYPGQTLRIPALEEKAKGG